MAFTMLKSVEITLLALAIIAKTAESAIKVVWTPASESFFAMA